MADLEVLIDWDYFKRDVRLSREAPPMRGLDRESVFSYYNLLY
jgi:hypothetical protein